MTSAESLRARAAECRENARRARHPEIAARWTEMAEHWIQLAEEQLAAEQRWHGLIPAHWAALGGNRPALGPGERQEGSQSVAGLAASRPDAAADPAGAA
jgi:hypothetical protein